MATINVTEMPQSMSLNAAIRVEPVQARSTARVNALLDAASATMHDYGYEQLTTAMVAERAGASIGTVYRYFPDRIAVLQAVASRNLETVKIALNLSLSSASPQNMAQAIDVFVDTMVDMFRNEKGFRSIRVGDVLDIRPVSGPRGANAELAAVIRDWVHEHLSLRLDSAGRLACETAVDVVDALLARAFMHSDRGEQTLIEEARRMARCSIEGPSA